MSRSFLSMMGGIALATFAALEIARRLSSGWAVDLSSSVWGPIVAALITGVVGVVLKAAMDVQVAKAQGKLQMDVERAMTSERKDYQNALLKMQGQVQEELAAVKAASDDRNSANAARRDYEYEARKRLYNEVEPILFQVYEALEESHYRVKSLARTARKNNLAWLENRGYYLTSTVYKILLPAAHLRLIQRRMTFVDLGLDPHIELRYLLLKLYVRSFTDDFNFASLSPELTYDPNHDESGERLIKAPAVYARQALVVGDLECIADLLIVKEGDKSRAVSFGEFEGLLSASPQNGYIQEAFSLFQAFTPEKKPVLARLLAAQACMAKLILSTYQAGFDPGALATRYDAAVTTKFAAELDWGGGQMNCVTVVATYWKARLLELDVEMTKRRSNNSA